MSVDNIALKYNSLHSQQHRTFPDPDLDEQRASLGLALKKGGIVQLFGIVGAGKRSITKQMTEKSLGLNTGWIDLRIPEARNTGSMDLMLTREWPIILGVPRFTGLDPWGLGEFFAMSQQSPTVLFVQNVERAMDPHHPLRRSLLAFIRGVAGANVSVAPRLVLSWDCPLDMVESLLLQDPLSLPRSSIIDLPTQTNAEKWVGVRGVTSFKVEASQQKTSGHRALFRLDCLSRSTSSSASTTETNAAEFWCQAFGHALRGLSEQSQQQFNAYLDGSLKAQRGTELLGFLTRWLGETDRQGRTLEPPMVFRPLRAARA